MHAIAARLSARADRFALAAGLALTFLVTWRMLVPFGGAHEWFAWADQSRYLLSARAFARAAFDPSLHHYPPGYAMMGAPFVWLLPAQPFAVPDLLCLTASLWIFTTLARRLTPHAPGWQAAAIAAFCIGAFYNHALRSVWIVPWNTTAAAPFALAALLCTLRVCESATPRRAATLGVVLGVMAGIRPSDAALLTLCCAAYALAELISLGTRSVLRAAAFCVAGLAVGALPFAVAHVAVHGISGGDYVTKSANIGFDWRLLSMRWVSIVIDPRPLLAEGDGLAERLPWIAPGLAGLLLLIFASGRQARAWRLVGGAIALHWCFYLSYRDLQPYGIWRFSNVHYFKWTFPFLVLAALRLFAALLRGPQRLPAALAMAATVLLMVWQPVGVGLRRLPIDIDADGGVRMAVDLSHINNAVFLPLQGEWHDIYLGHATLSTQDVIFRNTADFKLQPVPGGAMLQPLRILPARALIFHAAPGTAIVPNAPVTVLTEQLVLGLPCAAWPSRGICQWRAY